MTWLIRLGTILLISIFVLLLSGAAAIGVAYYKMAPDLPDITVLNDVQLQLPLKVYSQEGELIAEFGEKRRLLLDYAQIPQTAINAFVAAEDAAFFSHPGIDPIGLLRAAFKLITTGKRQQGGSTITMQVARNFYLSRDKTYLRKLYEIFLAWRIESELSKQDILALYLNKIYLGQRAYGIGAAAYAYYGKPLEQLNLAQTATLAGLPKAPSRYNPLANPKRALTRRNYVLRQMLSLDMIRQADYDQALAAPVSARRYKPPVQVEAPYVAEMVRAHLFEQYGEAAYTSGYEVYTTIQARDQAAANQALRNTLDAYSQRHGYHGAEAHYDISAETTDLDALLAQHSIVAALIPGIVTAVSKKTAEVYLGQAQTITLPWAGMNWAKKHINPDRVGPAPKRASAILKVGDLIRVRQTSGTSGQAAWQLTQVPRLLGALVSVRPADGAILALVGGYDYYTQKFNSATQAWRQPGSGLKAFVYSAALEHGYTPASILHDAPVVFKDRGLEDLWRPENYSGRVHGPTRLRTALTHSRNLISVRLLRDIGIPKMIRHIKRFGFSKDKLVNNLSLALGNASVTPLQMAASYAILANGGYRITPYFITHIHQNGELIHQATPATNCKKCDHPAPRAISAQNQYLMYAMMQDVIKYGTAKAARALKRGDLAGKTGTTNDQRDAWFNGFNQSVSASVWVGFDNNQKLGQGEVGGRVALPAWIDYMAVALQDIEDLSPDMPRGIVRTRIDPVTGLRVPPDNKNAITEVFRRKNLPPFAPVIDDLASEAELY
ncbi:MAG: penicillin-binding protein 1A [Pseudomonadota bacterium]